MRNCIQISSEENKVILKISENATWEEIENALNKKITEIKKITKDDKNQILVTGKNLRIKEIKEIQNIIKEKIDIKLDFDMPKRLGLHEITKTFSRDIAVSETKFVRTSVRSGQKIEFEGSLVIIGDVNAGAEVIAEDNIVVLGALRGLAHAGAKGNKEAIVAAGVLDAPQLRIANIVREIEREEEINSICVNIFVEDDKIIIE